jgi:glycine/D-amino acid oxidase-like deaminating enzyme
MGTPGMFRRYGVEKGTQFWQASLDALELIKELVYKEGIECDWEQTGDLSLAFKPSHFDSMSKKAEWYRANLGHEVQLVPQAELRSEIGSDAYYGGVIDPLGAGLHPAKLVFGLAGVAARYGAMLCEGRRVMGVKREGARQRVSIEDGSLSAKEVIAATNGYSGPAVPRLRSKVMPAGSYSIVTERLPVALQDELSPKGRMLWDSKWFLNYFRLTPDGRMLWGGRNNLSTSMDLGQSARILRQGMLRVFPQLADVPVTHSWSGHLGLTFDLMPHLGRVDGVHFALGYGGHGLHTALLLGRELGRLLTGEISSSIFEQIPHPTYFFYRGTPWFMPLAEAYYRYRDWVS